MKSNRSIDAIDSNVLCVFVITAIAVAAEAAAVIAVIHRSLLLAVGCNGGGHITMKRKLVIFFHSFSLRLMYMFMPNAYYRYCGVHAQ